MSTAATDAVTPQRIMQMAWGYAPPLIMEAAIRTKLFDALDGGAKTAEELTAATGASLRGVRTIANALSGLGLLQKEDGRYSLTPESASFLVSTKPSYMGGLIKHGSKSLIPRWLHLGETVQTGKASRQVNDQQDGAEFFQQLVEDIYPLSYGPAMTLAAHLKVSDAGRPVKVLDLAAGSGVWGFSLAANAPNVSVTAVDWPVVLEVTKRSAARLGVAERSSFIAGDLSEVDFGSGYDVATLGHILHSEGETQSRTLLKKVFRALAPGGSIAIAEFLVDDERAKEAMGLIFAVNMLVNTDEGDTFSANEIFSWLREAGFENTRTLDAPGPSPLILANKPR